MLRVTDTSNENGNSTRPIPATHSRYLISRFFFFTLSFCFANPSTIFAFVSLLDLFRSETVSTLLTVKLAPFCDLAFAGRYARRVQRAIGPNTRSVKGCHWCADKSTRRSQRLALLGVTGIKERASSPIQD